MKHAPKLATPSERRQVDRTHPALVLLTAADRAEPASIGRLTTLLAQALSRDFGDAVLVAHLADPAHHDDHWSHHHGPPSMSPSTSIAGPHSLSHGFETDPGHADHLRLPVPADPTGAAEVLLDRLRPLFLRYAYVFVDATARGLAWSRLFEEELGHADLRGVVRRLVVLADDDGPPPPAAEPPSRIRPSAERGPMSRRRGMSLPPPPPAAPWSVLRTRLLPPRADAPAPSSDHPPHSFRDRVHTLKKLGTRFFERLGGSAIEPQGEPYPAARVVPERCRVRIDLKTILAQPEPVLARLPEPTQQAFYRWARALTWRRVGVALGGSGAWGYAHVALLQELEERGVPVDIIGGSSMGALIGAYYSVMGRAGLELAVERGPRFERMALASMITSTVIDISVDADLGDFQLEDLEILLLPVATNLSHARAEVMTKSTVASAVRASASAPGVFASTITRAGLYVDGAVTDNVPVVLVERMGADLLVACNPLPPPPSLRVRLPTTPLSDFLAELNPVNRLRDLLVSFELMFHDFGDCEEADHRVVYEPPPEAGPLFRTFNYGKARALVDEVKREEAFRSIVQRSVDAWSKLAAARAG